MLKIFPAATQQSLKNQFWLLQFLILCQLLILTNNLEILPSSTILTPATVGIPYNQTFTIDTPIQPASNIIISNLSILPPNLSLQGNLLIGIPLRSGNVQIILALTSNNAIVNNTQKTYNLTINGITTNSVLPTTYSNVGFSYNVTYIGGIAPFFYQLSNNPSWLRINNSVILGTP